MYAKIPYPTIINYLYSRICKVLKCPTTGNDSARFTFDCYTQCSRRWALLQQSALSKNPKLNALQEASPVAILAHV